MSIFWSQFWGTIAGVAAGGIITYLVSNCFAKGARNDLNEATEKIIITTKNANKFTAYSLGSIAGFINIKWGTDELHLGVKEDGIFVDRKTGEEFTITVIETAKVDKYD